MNLTLMQFLSKHFGVFLGKVSGLGADDNAFAHDYHTTFLNSGLDLNTILAFRSPRMVAASSSCPGRGLSLRWPPSTRVGPRRITTPGPILTRFLERFFPSLLVPTQPLNQVGYTWSVYYNFDQYLWSPEGAPGRGIGVFFRFGASDGVANPIKYAYNVGIGAKGLVPGRPCDNFGIGWARTECSGNFVPFLRQQLRLGLGHEDAIELFTMPRLPPGSTQRSTCRSSIRRSKGRSMRPVMRSGICTLRWCSDSASTPVSDRGLMAASAVRPGAVSLPLATHMAGKDTMPSLQPPQRPHYGIVTMINSFIGP
jgi:hypothetical protein